MDNRRANIDLVFRNGLKDYEVLPPEKVWDKIQPQIAGNQQPFIILRAAALAAAVVSIGFFAYQWGAEEQRFIDSSLVAVNAESEAPVLVSPVMRPLNRVENSLTIPKPVLVVAKEEIEFVDISSQIAAVPDLEISSDSDSETNKEVRNTLLGFTEKIEPQNTDKKYQSLTILTSPDQAIEKNKQRWSIAALASPSYYSKFTSGNNQLADQLMASEDNIVSYSGGVSFAYKVNKRFSIQSGIYYSSIGQIVDDISSFGGFRGFDYTKGDRNFEVLTTNGILYTNNPDVFLLGEGSVERITTSYTNDVFDPFKSNLSPLSNNLRQNLSYLELPVLMRYKFVDRLIDLNLVGGISYNMLVKNSVSTMVDGEKYNIGKTDGLNQVSFSSSIGMGMEYTISDKFTLNLEPTFRYYMNPFSKIAGITVHPYSFGIFSGVSYKF